MSPNSRMTRVIGGLFLYLILLEWDFVSIGKNLDSFIEGLGHSHSAMELELKWDSFQQNG